MNHLFRKEVQAHQKQSYQGRIFLTQPVSASVLTGFSVLFGGLLVGFLAFGTYTKKERVEGVLLPDVGLVRVAAPQAGALVAAKVVDGQHVAAGDALFVLTSERQTLDGQAQQAVRAQLDVQKTSLNAALLRQRDMTHINVLTEQQAVGSLRQQLLQLSGELSLYAEQVRIAADAWATHQALAAEGFISQAAVAQKKNDYLTQLGKQKEATRMHTAVQRELAAAQTRLKNAQLQGDNEADAIKRGVSTVEQTIVENEVKREVVVVAPTAGVVTAIQAQAGQQVGFDSPLLNIVPTGGVLEAHLYASSRAIGFIRVGATVLLRYAAFPYQKFGQHTGRVVSISQVALSVGELKAAGVDAKEPLYRLVVRPDAQTITAYGKSEPLQPSMRLEADVVLDERRIYEWLLEPLYSISGKL
ncbi:MAG: HlyD family secretion protein [Formosimonas sp.]